MDFYRQLAMAKTNETFYDRAMSDHPLWQPNFHESNCQRFADFCSVSADCYDDLYQWSIANPTPFWQQLIEWSALPIRGDLTNSVSADTPVWPRPKWFENVTLNYAECALSTHGDHAAIIGLSETTKTAISWNELRHAVSAVASALKSHHIGPGDIVAAVATHSIETIIAFLATTAIGAVWTSISPDSGTQFVVDRFAQVQPKWLFASTRYFYDGKPLSIDSKIDAIQAQLPTVLGMTCLDDLMLHIPMNDTTVDPIRFEPMPFDAPLAILYSSGTTGKPKPIVHGIGGTIVQHVKEHRLQADMNPGDRLFYMTTTSWMMWNWTVSALISGVSVVVFDGKPSPATIWTIVSEHNVTTFGTSAPWLALSQKSKTQPLPTSFPNLKSILSTGAPLLRDQYDYIYSTIQLNGPLASISGGTDIISCFAGAGPVPIIRGHLPCAGLGMAIDVVDDAGDSVSNKPGELICRRPFPSMPIHFLNDPDHTRYFDAYFSTISGVWTQGDQAIQYDDGSVEILGRSDTTIKRNGVRIGTADLYSAISGIPEVIDAMAIGIQRGGVEELVLFIKVPASVANPATLKQTIRSALTSQSVWFKPDHLVCVADIPVTPNGKKCELLIKKWANGTPIPTDAVIANPESLIEIGDVLATLSGGLKVPTGFQGNKSARKID